MSKIADIEIGPINLFGPIGNPEGGGTGILAEVLSTTVGLLSVIASIYFLYRVITGGLAIITAGGDKGKVAEARSTITNGIIGLLIVLFSTIFIGFIGEIIGISILDLEDLIGRIGN